MKKIFTSAILLFLTAKGMSQQQLPHPFYLTRMWYIQGYDMVFNMEGADINRDGHTDLVIGNANSTYVYYGGPQLNNENPYGIEDTVINVKYRGRCLAVCDYNGDGLKDLITMQFVSLDTPTGYWTTNLLFYYGSDTGKIAIDTTPTYIVPFPKLDWDGYFIGSQYVHCGDFNGDGKTDIVISSPSYRNFDNGSEGIIYIYGF